VAGRAGEGAPKSAAEREADALRQVMRQQREEAAFVHPPGLAPAAEGREARWERTRERLQREGLLERPQRPGLWRTAGWRLPAALAAGLLVVLVLVPRPDEGAIYGDPPVRRGSDAALRQIAVAEPRTEAEALERTLREAGWKAGLYQRGRTFVVDTSVGVDMPPAAREALVARGVRAASGTVRIEFSPR
jgi:hypothetical protein